MKIIIDCNVLIAAGLKDGLCREVLQEALRKGEIFLSKEVVLEYLLVSRRDKFKAHQTYLENIIERVAQAAHIIETKPSTFNLPDSNDKKYIDPAVSGAVDFLITGNLKDFPEKEYGGTVVLSPREFFNLISKK